MRVAILSRPGDCFPNIISIGLADMLRQLGVEHKIFYEAIPFLMRLLPMSEKPKHWRNNWHFRVRNKLSHYFSDRELLNELKQYDLLILSECLPNAYWKNYLAIETLKKDTGRPVFSYTDAFIDNAPIHKKKWLDAGDYGTTRYEMNLYPSAVTELRNTKQENGQPIGINISISNLRPIEKKGFIAVVDFAQPGYEFYRDQQLEALTALGIETITLQGRYPISEIRGIYQQAAVFFLAFPETFGLPIAECFASGTYVFTPDSAWPMAWRLDSDPQSWGKGELAPCFRVYQNKEHLIEQLSALRANYHSKEQPTQVFDDFIQYYPHFYYGDKDALDQVLKKCQIKGDL